MKTSTIDDLRQVIDRAIETESRIASEKATRYWYPLSLATYSGAEITEALDSMIKFRTTMSDKTARFENAFAKWNGSNEALMVNSGSSADFLLCLLMTNPLRPLLQPGDEILIPAVTWPTQIWSAMMAGLKVKLIDVDPATLNIDYDDLEANITSKTRALFVVHIMGNPCDMDRLTSIAKRHELLIVEDCCEAMGASFDGKKVGNFGIGGAFSFFFSHHITTMEGGMIVTDTADGADHLRLLRAHGWTRSSMRQQYSSEDYPDIDPRYAFVNWGMNVRPMEVQASFGLHQLERADDFAIRRAAMAAKFNAFISRTQYMRMPKVDPRAVPSWLALAVMVSKDSPFTSKEITHYLEEAGIETRPIVTGNMARHPVARLFPELSARQFKGADEIHDRGFYIGVSPLQTDEKFDRLLHVFEDFLKKFE